MDFGLFHKIYFISRAKLQKKSVFLQSAILSFALMKENLTIKWGFIGCGEVTEKKSGPAFNEVADSRVVAVMSRNIEKARNYAERHGIPRYYDDVQALIYDKEVQAVYIATPPSTHATYAIMAMKAGKAVYIEKPMATRYEDCLRINRIAETTGMPCFVAYYRRLLPYFQKVFSLVEEGAVGAEVVFEVLVIADGSGSPEIIAADLMAQSEHDPNAKGILVTTDEAFGYKVIEAVEEELKTLSTAGIASQSWQTYGEVAVADSLEEAIDLANAYAPEHLELNVEDAESIVPRLYNYGSLFIGENTAEVFGDYASGTNHTLPTIKASRYTGGVWVGTFLKTVTQQSMTREASKKIAPLVSRLAHGEGLEGHAIAAERRF